MKRIIFICLATFTLIVNTYSQAGSLDLSFNPDVLINNSSGEADGTVWATAVQSDGKILIGGGFNAYNGTTRNRIARLNPNGTLDTTFNPGTGANVIINAISIQSDGKIIIGGTFTSYNGTAINNIARLNADGTLDTTFNVGSGANTTVESISIQNDGKIIVSGLFNTFNGSNHYCIVRLNSNGTVDTSFIGGPTGYIFDSLIQNDGKIIIVGDFSDYNETPRNRIARLNANGTLDTTFDPGSGANGSIRSVSIQSDGKIVIAGNFTSFNGDSINRIYRLNSDGSSDSNFNPGTGANGILWCSSIQSDGKILIGGSFSNYNGTTRFCFIRLNSDGTLDSTFNSDIPGSNVFSTLIQSDGKIITVGGFALCNGNSKNSIARFNADGTFDGTFNPRSEVDGVVNTTAIQSDGKIIIGGDFMVYNGISRKRIARLNTDGTLDSTFNPGTAANASISTALVQSDGKIIIGGDFTSFNGTAKTRIARLNSNGTLDTTFNSGTGADCIIYSAVIQSDGKIIIGGCFTNYNGTGRNRILRLNADGSLDSTFNPGMGANAYINIALVQSDGKIIIGGDFTFFNGTPRNRIARLNSNGTLDTTFNPETGADCIIYTAVIQNNGKITIGGCFTTYNETVRNRISRLNADGSLDTTFTPGTGANAQINNISIQSDSKIIIGGSFTSYNGITTNRIARLNGNGILDTTFNIGSGFTSITNANPNVKSTSIQSDGKIIIGGNFTKYNGTDKNRIARINGDLPLDAPSQEMGTIVVYPNPTHSILNLSLNNGLILDKVIVVDITGKVVLEQTENLSTINVEKLAKGVYVLTVYAHNKKYQEKFIKE